MLTPREQGGGNRLKTTWSSGWFPSTATACSPACTRCPLQPLLLWCSSPPPQRLLLPRRVYTLRENGAASDPTLPLNKGKAAITSMHMRKQQIENCLGLGLTCWDCPSTYPGLSRRPPLVPVAPVLLSTRAEVPLPGGWCTHL